MSCWDAKRPRVREKQHPSQLLAYSATYGAAVICRQGRRERPVWIGQAPADRAVWHLIGSTELAARLDPEDVGLVIRACQGGAAEVIRRGGGHVAKCMDD